MRKYILSSLLMLAAPALTNAQQLTPFHYSITKTVEKKITRGAVVSAHPLASQAGMLVLQQGGNAVDAAIATQLALAVVFPQAGNLGGGGFMVAKLKDGTSFAIDYREKAPGRASRDMYLDGNGDPQTRLSLDGHLASGVPGTVAGLFRSHGHGKLPFAQLIAPAILLAEKGFVITEDEASGLNRQKRRLLQVNTRPTAFVRDRDWKAGDTLVQPELAHTLQLIAQQGAAGFYAGETAEKITAEMQRGGGLISKEDLKNYAAQVRQPVVFTFRGYTILTMSLPSSGGICLQQMLGMVEKYPLEKWGFHDPRSVQLMIEAERRAYVDRSEFLGDPDFVKVPVQTLTAKRYLEERMQTFTPGKASKSADIKPLTQEHLETTHLSVYDAEGNAVAVTTTLNGSYGSGVVVGGAGFFLNNEMDDFSVKPGTPNMFGLTGKEANAIQPGKRMLSSMTPTIVLQNNKPVMVTGTPGGSTIITSVFQTILNTLVFKLDAEQSVNAPKFHHQWLPDEVYVEKDFPASTRLALEKMGYKIVQCPDIGRTELIHILPGGKVKAVGDKRGDDSAAAL